jgi:hypothetical protein
MSFLIERLLMSWIKNKLDILQEIWAMAILSQKRTEGCGPDEQPEK